MIDDVDAASALGDEVIRVVNSQFMSIASNGRFRGEENLTSREAAASLLILAKQVGAKGLQQIESDLESLRDKEEQPIQREQVARWLHRILSLP